MLIARALAQRPHLLLMDEPTNHLDIGSQHHVLQIVRSKGVADGIVQAEGTPREALPASLVSSTYGVTAERATADDGTPQFLFRSQEAPPAQACGPALTR